MDVGVGGVPLLVQQFGAMASVVDRPELLELEALLRAADDRLEQLGDVEQRAVLQRGRARLERELSAMLAA